LESVANSLATAGQRGRRQERWERLRWLWDHSTLKRVPRCRLHATGTMVTAWVASGKGAYWSGLQTCGSVWACPVCGPIIRQRRSELIEAGAGRWEELGGSLAFLTLTVRHHQGEGLRGLYEGMQGAWGRLQQSRWWRDLGWAGYWRAVDVTWGAENGWHPHLHVLLLANGNSAGGLGAGLSERWRSAVVRAGLAPTSLERGAVLAVGRPALGGYLAKVDGGWGIGAELARSDVKAGRADRFTPWDVLGSACDGEVWAVRTWAEYEAATFGRRCIESSRGLGVLLDVEDEPTDEELVEQDQGGELVLSVHRRVYRALAKSGYAATVLDVIERDGPRAGEAFVDAFQAVKR